MTLHNDTLQLDGMTPLIMRLFRMMHDGMTLNGMTFEEMTLSEMTINGMIDGRMTL